MDDPSFAVVASSSSGLPVSINSADENVSINGLEVDIVGPGHATITATQAGDAVTNAADAVSVTFCIRPVKPVVTVEYKDTGAILSSSSSDSKQWYKEGILFNGTAQQVEVNENGTYTLIVTVDGCESDPSEPIEVKIKVGQTITLSPIKDKTMGDPVFTVEAVSSSGLPVSIETIGDNISSDGFQITLLQSGQATIKATQGGDENTNPATPVLQTFCINPPKPEIVLSSTDAGTVLASSSPSNTQWFRDDILLNSGDQSINVVDDGIYALIVSVEGCQSEMSEQVLIHTGIEKSARSGVSIYPNPVNDYLHVQVQAASGLTVIQIRDPAGKIVYAGASENGGEDIDVSTIQAGIYILQLSSGLGESYHLFLKR